MSHLYIKNLSFIFILISSFKSSSKCDLIYSINYGDKNVNIKFLAQDSCCDIVYDINLKTFHDSINNKLFKFIYFNNKRIYYDLDKNTMAKSRNNLDSLIRSRIKDFKFDYGYYPRLELVLIIDEKGELQFKGQGYIRKPLLDLHKEFFQIIQDLEFKFEQAIIDGKPVASIFYYNFIL